MRAEKIWRVYSIIKAFHTSLRLFVLRKWVATIMICWLAILEWIKLLSWLPRTTSALPSIETLMHMSKAVCHKLYGYLQLLPVPIHWWKNLSMDFATGFLFLVDRKSNSYNAILVIVDCLIKMIYYKPVKIIINTVRFAKVIINIVVRHHGFLESIISNRCSLFTSKFWYSLCFFFSIKWKLSTTFHPQKDSETKR